MSELALLGLARSSDAREIAEMSRDLIEHGLTWSWTPARVLRLHLGPRLLGRGRAARAADRRVRHHALRRRDRAPQSARGRREHRRQGLGRQLMEWLTATAIEAGIFRINLELRAQQSGRAGISMSAWASTP